MSRKYNIIMEHVQTVSFNSNDPNITVLEEERMSNGNLKAICRVKLQTGEERNQNKRYYSMDVCKSIVEQLNEKANTRSLLMEVDY